MGLGLKGGGETKSDRGGVEGVDATPWQMRNTFSFVNNDCAL